MVAEARGAKTRVWPNIYSDINEEENEIYFEVELPGVHKEDVDLRVYEQGFFLRGDAGNVVYSANWTFPGTVEPGQTRAEYDSGLLMITIPFVKPISEAKKIEIE